MLERPQFLPSPADMPWKEFQEDPLPGWARKAGTLFDMPPASFRTDSQNWDLAVCSVPYDSTASTRIGARTGPSAIREASLAYASQARSRGEDDLLNLRSGEVLRPLSMKMADFGDLHVYPSNPERQVRATTAEVMQLALISSRIIVLGGEHTITYPAVSGLTLALEQKTPDSRLGYLHIDHHFDFGDESILHGPFYHGSNSRRISELPSFRAGRMAFVGMGDFTLRAQYERMIEAGMTVRTMNDVRTQGLATCLTHAVDALLQDCNRLYVSIDIDVCDTSVARGTGNVTIGGIGSADFLKIADVLRPYPVVGLDIVEVNALLDTSGATAHLAARLLYELFMFEASSS